MTTHDAPLAANWLLQETPLGIPLFTPFHVRLSSESCQFKMDAHVVRMVYLGGLSVIDGSQIWWVLYGPPQAERRGVEIRNPWRTDNEFALQPRFARLQVKDQLPQSPGEALAVIEQVSGASRRRLTHWLQTSHTTLNGIARGRRPRSSLALRLTALYRLFTRLQALQVFAGDKLRDALTTPSLNGKSALQYAFADDYERAATAAQLALKPPKNLIAIRGSTFGDSPMTAVEDL